MLVAITRLHHYGVAGIIWQGLSGLMLADTLKMIAQFGGTRGVFETNPIAFAASRKQKKSLVICITLSKVAQGKILVAIQQVYPILESWALDEDGKSTTNPELALLGKMIPIGRGKGAALTLLVEFLAAALTTSEFGFQASFFFSAQAPPALVDQLQIAIAPNSISNIQFETRLEELIEEVLIQGNTSLHDDRQLNFREKFYQNSIRKKIKQYQ